MQVVAEALLPKAKITPVEDRNLALLELQAGRADAVVFAVFDAIQITNHKIGDVSLPELILRNPATLAVARKPGNAGHINFLTNWVQQQRSLGLAQGKLARAWEARGIDLSILPPRLQLQAGRAGRRPDPLRRRPAHSILGGAMFDFSVITGNAHLLWQGLLITLYCTVITIGAGLVLGLTIGLVQLSTIRPLVWLGWMFVEFFRNIPLLVLLLWTYYALPIFLGINITKGWAGFLALSCYTAAFYAEILRAGVQSIDPGQTDAATALGMSYGQRMRRIILPQALRRMIPPLAGQSIIQMKNTTLLSAITVPDLLYQGSYISSFTYRPMEVYTAIGGSSSSCWYR